MLHELVRVRDTDLPAGVPEAWDAYEQTRNAWFEDRAERIAARAAKAVADADTDPHVVAQRARCIAATS